MELPLQSSSSTNQLPSDPHGALFIVLNYLSSPDLLSLQLVCKSFHQSIPHDPLLWRHITLLNTNNLTDEILLSLTSRAEGNLQSLILSDCRRITDAGLFRVITRNPSITKLHVPGCTNLTADGIVRVVKRLTEHKGKLEQLRLCGIYNITIEHLNILNSSLCKHNEYQVPHQSFYGNWHSLSPENDDDRPIDIDICPKCRNIRLVFDCTRENCRSMKNRWIECRGCFFCIARCEECGGCIDSEELGEETLCSHLLCLECWLCLPKCNMCNRPYCNGHARDSSSAESAVGFVCEECRDAELVEVGEDFQSLGT